MDKVVFATLLMLLTHAYGYNIPEPKPIDNAFEMEEASDRVCFFAATVESSCSSGASVLVFTEGDKEAESVTVEKGTRKICAPAQCQSDGGKLNLVKEVMIGGQDIEATPGVLDAETQKLQLYASEDACNKDDGEILVKIECVKEELDEDDDTRSAIQEMNIGEMADDSVHDTEEMDLSPNMKTVNLQWNNWFRGTLHAQCPNRYALFWVKSQHSNHYEDRLWLYYCKCIANENYNHCYWTGHDNGHDQPSLQYCAADYVMAGVYSNSYSAGHRDRLFRILCCRTPHHYTRACSFSGFVNGWDAFMHYAVGGRRVFTGIYSYHDNSREDRRFRFADCHYFR